MPPPVAALVCALGILGLFALDQDRTRTSKALWIPVVWLSIVGSREVSQWLAAFGVGHAAFSSQDAFLEGSPVDRLIYTGLLILGIAVLIGRKSEAGRLLRSNGPILLFFFYCAVSISWSDYPGVAFKRWIKALGDVVIIMIVLTDRHPSLAVKRLLARTGFLLIPLSVLLIKYYPDLGKSFKHYGTSIYFGVTTNKNLLGLICLVFGLGAFWRFLSAYRDRGGMHRTRRLVVHGAFLAMVLWLLSAAHSMTGLACFVLGSFLIAATSFRAVVRSPWAVRLLIALLVCVSFSTLFLGMGGDALETMGKDATLTGRTDIWNLVLSLQPNSLVGAGFESFWLPGPRLDKIWHAYWWHPNEAHNGYIEVYLNLGWIGVFLLAVLIVTGYRNVALALRCDPDAGRLRLAYFVVGLVYNFTEAGFRMLDPVWITFLLAIIAVPGGWGDSKATSLVKVDTIKPQLRPPLEQVRPSWNL